MLHDGLQYLVDTQRWNDVEAALMDPLFLEEKVEAGLVFELVEDFAIALRQSPSDRPLRSPLELVAEALRRDVHFVVKCPSTLFQCLWNIAWWYDSEAAASYYDPPDGGWLAEGPPWSRSTRLSQWLESWRRLRESRTPRIAWLRSLRPPVLPLESALRIVINVDTSQWRVLNLTFNAEGTRLLASLNPLRQLGWGWSAPVEGLEDAIVRAWDPETGRNLQLDNRQRPFTAVVSMDGTWRADLSRDEKGGGWGKPVCLTNTTRGRVISLTTDPDVNIQKLAFSANGKRLIGGGWSECGEAMVWDVPSGKRIAWLRPSDSIFAVALSPDGKTAALGFSDGIIQLWDVDAGEPRVSMPAHDGCLQALDYSRDGKRLASAAGDGTIRLWDIDRIRPVPKIKAHPDDVRDVVFSKDGARLVTMSTNATTWVWDANTGAPVACPFKSDSVVMVGGAARGGIFADTKRIHSLAHLATWRADTGDVVRKVDEDRGYHFASCDIIWTVDGNHAAIRHGAGRAVGLVDPERPKQVKWLAGHQDINGMAFSPDGQKLAACGKDGTVRISSVPEGAPLVTLSHPTPVTCVNYATDGIRIVSAGTDCIVRIWDVGRAVELAHFHVPDAGIWSQSWCEGRVTEEIHGFREVAFAADGETVLTLSNAERVRQWRPTGECLREWQGIGNFKALADALALQPFARDGVLEIESLADGSVIARVPCPQGVLREPNPAVHPNGRAWAAGAGQHVYFWALTS